MTMRIVNTGSKMERQRPVAKWGFQQSLIGNIGELPTLHCLQVWQRFQAAYVYGARQPETQFGKTNMDAMIERGRNNRQPETLTPRSLRLACKPCADKTKIAGRWGVSGCLLMPRQPEIYLARVVLRSITTAPLAATLRAWSSPSQSIPNRRGFAQTAYRWPLGWCSPAPALPPKMA